MAATTAEREDRQRTLRSEFFVDQKYTFEVGCKNKKRKQIKDISDSYILADNIEYGTDRRIPIWLLGFLYLFFFSMITLLTIKLTKNIVKKIK